jgi:5-methylcytosine-specific restriction endonuclease McrA
MNQYKACSKCKQVKLLSDFDKSRAAKSGHKPACKDCKSQSNKVYRAENKELIRAIHKAWYKNNPEKIKQYQLTAKQNSQSNPEYRKAYYAKNKEKLTARHRQWRAKNHEKARQIEKNYRLNNPEMGRLQNHRRRALKLKNGIYLITTQDSIRLMKNTCFYCGHDSQHLDHVIPLSRGGRHSLGNLVASCAKCNISKNNKTIMEWRVWQKRVLR